MDQFSNPLEDPHPVRLLTLARVLTSPSPEAVSSVAAGGAETTGGGGGANSSSQNQSSTATVETHTLCLTVELAARDRALMVSTVERTYDFLSSADHEPGKG